MPFRKYGIYTRIEDAYKAILGLIGRGYHKDDIILLCSQGHRRHQGDKADVQEELLNRVSLVYCTEEAHARILEQMPQNSDLRFMRERLRNGAYVILLQQTDACSI